MMLLTAVVMSLLLNADECSRLAGHQVERAGVEWRIVDVAGQGAPRVGRVERRGRELWLLDETGPEWRLSGVLAIPRIAGPGYRVWVIGAAIGDVISVARIGVLSAPQR